MKKNDIFSAKQKTSKITIRIETDLKKRLVKAINSAKKAHPELKISVNELLKQYINTFIEQS